MDTPPPDDTALTLITPLPLDRHPVVVYLSGLGSAGSRRTMHTALNRIAALLTDSKLDAMRLNWGALHYAHTNAIRAQLSRLYKPATANTMLAALRGVLQAAWRLGYMSAEAYQAAAAVKSVRGTSVPAGRELHTGELQALLAVCAREGKAAGIRDAALIGILYGAGLRRAEVVALDFAHYEPATGKLHVRGKGNKERLAWIVDAVAAALDEWLMVRGEAAGPLFWHINKGGVLVNRRLTTQAVYHILQKRARQAQIPGFSPHDLRRTFVSDLLDAGADISTVARMAGHANIQTTARYDRRPEDAKRRAAGLLQFPNKKNKKP